jgi:outer membrane lipoprotein LolB
MRKWLSIAFLMYTLFLYGCATQMEPPFDQPTYQRKPWKIRQTKLSDQTYWDIHGAVSITSRGKTQMGSFAWEQNQSRYAISIYGPLNLGSIRIVGSPGDVTLVKPSGAFSAPSPEALMQQQLGWYLPVSNMVFWVRGLPAPGKTGKQVHDEYGHLVFLQQQGWTIQYQAFEPHDRSDLPRKILMDNQALHVKLVIKNWNLG